MLSRLTALILTLCIGLPMCWCCITAPQQEEVASCCAKQQHSASEHSQEPNCPCAKHENARDVAATFVNAPAPALKLLAEPVWSTSSPAILSHAAFESLAPRHDHGPPLHTPPLYARHCALLI
jgi:hypothetical protein